MATVAGPRTRFLGWLWLAIAAGYFLLPLLVTAWFSVRTGRDKLGLEAYGEILRDPTFRASLAFSFRLALFTIVVVLLLLVPTVYWVHLRLPRLRPVIEFLSVLPFVVPPIVLVVGLLRGVRWAPIWFYGGSPILVAGYVVLTFPYVYWSVDAGVRGLDIQTLTEAARSLGSGWPTVLVRVIVPNLRSSLISAAFLTLAIVMGEFTMALVMQFTTYAVYISYVMETRATGAAALSLISFAITWSAMVGIVLLGRGLGGRTVQIGVTR
jgi:putative spermidine/putrescine transport system permease protein